MVLSSDELNCKSETQYIGMYNLCTEVKSRSNCAIFKLTGILLYIFLCKRYVHINKYNICTCKHTYYVYIINMYTLTNSTVYWPVSDIKKSFAHLYTCIYYTDSIDMTKNKHAIKIVI